LDDRKCFVLRTCPFLFSLGGWDTSFLNQLSINGESLTHFSAPCLSSRLIQTSEINKMASAKKTNRSTKGWDWMTRFWKHVPTFL
jgi:hypothetical protein